MIVFAPPSRGGPARGFTLIEMLVALAITLIMMGAVVSLFGVISNSVASSRSALEMSDRLRAARNQLQLDLQGATATMRPPLRPENDEGYLEIMEGLAADNLNRIADVVFGNADDHLLLFGDTDDVLMLTVRSRGAPFVGKYLNGGIQTVIESPVAEVLYFMAPNGFVIDATTTPPKQLYTLYRRVLLVAPGVASSIPATAAFYDNNDLSVRYEEPGTIPTLFLNTLGDLTKRENRFAHYDSNTTYAPDFPFFAVTPPTTWPMTPTPWPTDRPANNAFLGPCGYNPFNTGPNTTARIGDDVLLTNVLAFDVQVWDPDAPIFVPSTGGVALEPSDPGWRSTAEDWKGATYPDLNSADPKKPVALGAYVDLGYGVASIVPPSPAWPVSSFPFIAPPDTKSGVTASPFIYDTWSLHYENDGLDADGDPIDAANPGDRGTNGLDDTSVGNPGYGVVDDITEYDTLPPYSAPLRGIRVKIRVYEPDSQVVREAIVVQNFLPE